MRKTIFYRYVIFNNSKQEWVTTQRNFRTSGELSKAAVFAQKENAEKAIRHAIRYGMGKDFAIYRLRVELDGEA